MTFLCCVVAIFFCPFFPKIIHKKVIRRRTLRRTTFVYHQIRTVSVHFSYLMNIHSSPFIFLSHFICFFMSLCTLQRFLVFFIFFKTYCCCFWWWYINPRIPTIQVEEEKTRYKKKSAPILTIILTEVRR